MLSIHAKVIQKFLLYNTDSLGVWTVYPRIYYILPSSYTPLVIGVVIKPLPAQAVSTSSPPPLVALLKHFSENCPLVVEQSSLGNYLKHCFIIRKIIKLAHIFLGVRLLNIYILTRSGISSGHGQGHKWILLKSTGRQKKPRYSLLMYLLI